MEGSPDVKEWGQYAPIIAKMAYQSVISKATSALKIVGKPDTEMRIFDDNRLHWMFCKDNVLTCYYYVQSSACESTIHDSMSSEDPFWSFYQKTSFDLNHVVDLDTYLSSKAVKSKFYADFQFGGYEYSDGQINDAFEVFFDEKRQAFLDQFDAQQQDARRYGDYYVTALQVDGASVEITWFEKNGEVCVVSPSVLEDVVHFSIQDKIAVDFDVGNIFPSDTLSQHDKSQYSGDLNEAWVWEDVDDVMRSSLPEIDAINADIDEIREAGYNGVAECLQARLNTLCGTDHSAAQDHYTSQCGPVEDAGSSIKPR